MITFLHSQESTHGRLTYDDIRPKSYDNCHHTMPSIIRLYRHCSHVRQLYLLMKLHSLDAGTVLSPMQYHAPHGLDGDDPAEAL